MIPPSVVDLRLLVWRSIAEALHARRRRHNAHRAQDSGGWIEGIGPGSGSRLPPAEPKVARFVPALATRRIVRNEDLQVRAVGSHYPEGLSPRPVSAQPVFETDLRPVPL